MLLPFWLLASLMIAVALAVVLPPLLRERTAGGDVRRHAVVDLYRAQRAELDVDLARGHLDPDSHREACEELQRRLLEDSARSPPAQPLTGTAQPLVAVSIALLVPVLAFGIYFQLGAPAALSPPPVAAQDPRIPHSVEEMLEGLRQRLVAQPEDADGWVMLGRSYASINRLQDARDALRRAVALRPEHALSLVALAEVLAGLNANRLDGEPLALIERALRSEPTFARALWLAGVAYHNTGDNDRAVAAWTRLQALGLVPEAAEQVARAISRAGGAVKVAAPAAALPSITVTVRVAPELLDRLRPDDTLFVFARAAEGPRMPLAIARHRAAELPVTVTLDDSQAMTPQMRLSAFAEVTVGARVSRSGNATPASGDLEGDAGAVRVAAGARTEVVITGIVP